MVKSSEGSFEALLNTDHSFFAERGAVLLLRGPEQVRHPRGLARPRPGQLGQEEEPRLPVRGGLQEARPRQ